MTTFLIVEDDHDLPDLLRQFFKTNARTSGANVLSVDTLAGAFKHAQEASVILLDLTLNDANIQTTLKAIPELSKHAPVIVITGSTAYVGDLLIDAVLKFGADFAIYKTLIVREGIEWLILEMQAAMMRRARLKTAQHESK